MICVIFSEHYSSNNVNQRKHVLPLSVKRDKHFMRKDSAFSAIYKLLRGFSIENKNVRARAARTFLVGLLFIAKKVVGMFIPNRVSAC